eukprot:TRINITY_DN138_c0_g3_i1.p1 TRINITY_DN138_c0_g3~~TRINITY_DN138_c0_g3_i1.p1  ORF type:complete len:327 (-),score=42.30 TRINITY_DN138_c0_g3_i1:276-1256(-)
MSAKEEGPAFLPATAVQWQWCQKTEVHPCSLSDKDWGTYAESDAIEAAFKDGVPSVTITVGLVKYTIIFEGRHEDTELYKEHGWIKTSPGHKQVNIDNPSFWKIRNVRRQVATMRQAVEHKAVAGECSLCYSAFADNPHLPRKRPWQCVHEFHGACIQHWVDLERSCPMCRKGDVTDAAVPQKKGRRHAKRQSLQSVEECAAATEALISASVYDDVTRVRQLIDAGAVVDALDDAGTFALLNASVKGHLNVCRTLLESRASANMTTPGGVTALMLSAYSGNIRVVELLLDHRADPAMREAMQMTASDLARQGEEYEIQQLLDVYAR